MANPILHEKAIKLRLKGYTYGQIKRELSLSKSTLSDWLRNLPLSKKQLILLSKNRANSEDIRVEKFRQTAKNKLESRLKKILSDQKGKLLPLSKKELFIAGIFLYWGEGSKQRGIIAISNTNPQVMQFAKFWMTKILGISPKKLVVRLHLYKDMDINEHIEFWSHILNIPKSQFNKSYIKNTTREGLTYKSFGHGTCNLICFDTTLSERIAMSIRLIVEQCGAKNDKLWYN